MHKKDLLKAWQDDIAVVARSYFHLIRSVIGNSPETAIAMFCLRGPRGIVYKINRLRSSDIERLIRLRGLPFSVNEEQLASHLTDAGDAPAAWCENEWSDEYFQIKWRYWNLVREIARHCVRTAAEIAGVGDLSLMHKISMLGYGGLEMLARLDALTFDPSIAYKVMLQLVHSDEAKVQNERLAIAACAGTAYGATRNQPLGVGSMA